MSIAAEGSAGTWEILSSPPTNRGVADGRVNKHPGPVAACWRPCGSEISGTAVVPPMAKENEAEAGRMAGSLSVLVVPVKQGERTIDRHPVEGRKTPEHGIVLGNYDGCIGIRTSYPRDRNG